MLGPIDRSSLRAWLADRPPEYACLLATRAALRLVPLLGKALHRDSDDRESMIVLPSLRALASASFAASSPDRAEEVVHSVDAVCQGLTDTTSELAYGIEISIIDYRDIDDLVCLEDIHNLEQDKAGIYVVQDVISVASHANQTSLYRTNYNKNIASKEAVIEAASSTISNCENALIRHIFQRDTVAEIENTEDDSTHSSSNERENNELMAVLLQDVELLDLEGSGDAVASDIVSILSGRSLWLDNIPVWVSDRWRIFKNTLRQGSGWQVWTDWYEACLAGVPSRKSLEQVLPTISSAVWQCDISEINRHIRESIQSRSAPAVSVLDQSPKKDDSKTPSTEPETYIPNPQLGNTPSSVKHIGNDVAQQYEYDVAISVAGPDRKHAQDLYDALTENQISVFYDKERESSLWGKNLAPMLFDVFNKKARYCVVFVSKVYKDRKWTTHEFRSALARAVDQKGVEYILPIRIDDTEIDGLSPAISYVPIRAGVEQIVKMIIEKLEASKQPPTSGD